MNAIRMVDRIIDYESGQLSREEVIELFQALIDSGDVWRLQGSYGRTAVALIEAGLCVPKKANGETSH